VVVIAVLRKGFPGFKPVGPIDPHGGGGIVVGIAVGEAVGEELVDVDVAPIGGGREILVALRAGEKAVGGIQNEAGVVRKGVNGKGGREKDDED